MLSVHRMIIVFEALTFLCFQANERNEAYFPKTWKKWSKWKKWIALAIPKTFQGGPFHWLIPLQARKRRSRRHWAFWPCLGEMGVHLLSPVYGWDGGASRPFAGMTAFYWRFFWLATLFWPFGFWKFGGFEYLHAPNILRKDNSKYLEVLKSLIRGAFHLCYLNYFIENTF